MTITQRLSHLVVTIFYRSSWVIFFALLCGMIYERSLGGYRVEYKALRNHMEELERELSKAKYIHNDLTHRVNSQSDPAWIEMTLIKGLGLTPEGQKKVVFNKKIDP